ncbi:MAG: PorV/PorQ family protein, partial [Bacteroidaceae bacterium]|nr:PorV/PorQ family protein [Bacteroidaceae bacterium]
MKKIIAIAFALWAFTLQSVLADDWGSKNQFNPVQTGVSSLSIAPDSRGGGMGDVGVATDADVYSQHWNPAKYPFNISRAGLGLSYTPWLRQLVSDIDLAYLSGFYRIGD